MAITRRPKTQQAREVRTYTDVERAHALAVLAGCNGNLSECHRLTGIPVRTIASWREKPMAGSLRVQVAEREALMAQMVERLLWKLGRAAKGALADAKLPGIINGMGTLFTMLRLLRANPTTDPADGTVAAGFDLTKLSADELRTLLDLVARAGGDVERMGIVQTAAPAITDGEVTDYGDRWQPRGASASQSNGGPDSLLGAPLPTSEAPQPSNEALVVHALMAPPGDELPTD